MNKQAPAIWWLNPAVVFGVAGVLIGIAAYAIPEPLFRTYWRMPKFFDGTGLALTLACVAVFGFGVTLGSKLFTRAAASLPQLPAVPDIPGGLLTRLFNICVALSILGYAIWLGLAIQRGITLSAITDIMKGEKGAMYDARFTYLPTVGGVTTLTQFGTAAAILGVLLGCRTGWKRVAPKLAVIFVLAGVRALLNSERFALLELAVPMLVIYLRLRYVGAQRVPAPLRVLITAAPLLGMAALFFVFTGFEYFRSWSNYYSGRDLNLWQFGGLRLLGYYVTSFNNGAFLIRELGALNAPYFTLRCLWRFPLTAPVFARLYPNPMFATADEWFYFPFLEAAGNLEFNNADGMLFPMMDFGIPGGLIYWLLAGLICGILYRLYSLQSPAGLLLYPVVFLNVLEVPLALYWGEGRAFPSICLLILAVPLIAYVRRRRQFEENVAKAEREIMGVSWVR
jgi:hypothetical protein